MTSSIPHSLDNVNPRYHAVAFDYAPRFDLRYVLDDSIIMPYFLGVQFPDNILLFSFDCDNFRSHMCADSTKSEAPNFVIDRLEKYCARGRDPLKCVCGRVSLLAAAGFDFPSAPSDDVYKFC